jgi:glycosyltransferase involved in cell wall biosynthesis
VTEPAPAWLIAAGDFVRTGGMDAANFALAGYLARIGRETHLAAHRVDPELRRLPGIHAHWVPRPLGSHLLGFPLLALCADLLGSTLRGGFVRPPVLPPRRMVTLANGGNFHGRATWLHYVHAAYDPEIAGRPVRRAVHAAAGWKMRRDEREVARAAAVVIANSERTAGHAVDLLGVEPSKVHVVYYGADAERFRPPSPEERSRARLAMRIHGEAPVLAFVGALGDRRKGFDTLFHAFHFLCHAQPGWDATLLVIGTGAELDDWKRRAEAARLGRRIRFLGFRLDVREVLWAADGFVAPTRYEAYGLAVHEALCMGIAPVVSRRAGVAERIPPALHPLLLDDPDDVPELAARLVDWAANLEPYRAAALDASVAIRGWGWDQMAARIVDIVEGAG